MLSSQPTKKPYKIVLLGDSGVGKTAIIQRFTSNKFEQKDNPTVGIDFISKNFTDHNKSYRLQLWDTAGQERFRSLIPSYMKDSSCAIFVYDISKEETVEHLEEWIKIFKESKAGNNLMVACGNKIDLGKQVHDQQLLESIMGRNGMKHFQVSALSGQNVNEMFHQIVEALADEQQRKKNHKLSQKKEDMSQNHKKNTTTSSKRDQKFETDVRLKSMTNLADGEFDNEIEIESQFADGGAKKLKGGELNSHASEDQIAAPPRKCMC